MLISTSTRCHPSGQIEVVRRQRFGQKGLLLFRRNVSDHHFHFRGTFESTRSFLTEPSALTAQFIICTSSAMDVLCQSSVWNVEDEHEGNRKCPLLVMHIEFSCRLKTLERKGTAIQYQLACLSTLGGAYHLSNRPETAFMIAYRQETVGRLLGSLNVVIRAKVFQAVNLSLLGQPKMSRSMFKVCKKLASENSWTGMMAFVEASELWLNTQLALKDGSSAVSGAVDSGAGWADAQDLCVPERRAIAMAAV